MIPNNEIPSIRIHAGIGLVSAAIIAFQLALMQILSCTQWYHFAYMIISVALLGFGAAGTCLALFKQKAEQKYAQIFPLLLLLTAILIPLATRGANSSPVRFDSLLIFQNPHHTLRLVATYCLYFLPFFTGALAIGLSFTKYAHQIGKLYFSNLLGAGTGGIIALLLMQLLPPEEQPLAAGVMALAGGIIALPPKAGPCLRLATAASLGVLILLGAVPAKLKPSEYKDISKALLLPEAKLEYEQNSPHGLVQIVASPTIRFAPGVSLSYQHPFPVRKVVFNNGNWAGYLVPAMEKRSMLDYTPQALAYRMAKVGKALILDAGTGENISLALSHNVPCIVATEVNAGIFALLRQSFATRGNVRLCQTMSRTFLACDTVRYDLVELPVVGTFFGNSGLNAIETRYELTSQALGAMWDRLSPNGTISLSCWMDYPVRNAYRLLASIGELLEKEGKLEGNRHLLAIRSWCSITFLVKKSAFSTAEITLAQEFCDKMMFDPLIIPGSNNIEQGKYNLLQDSRFFDDTRQLISSQRNNFMQTYPYRVQPTTDDRPFFFQNIRWTKIKQVIASWNEGRIPSLELGYLLVLFTFIQIILIAGFLIVLPLVFKSWKSGNKTWVFVYFSSIGVAYMLFEIMFIQQFTFYFGQPTYGTAACISILLIASGLGSYYSGILKQTTKMLFLIPTAIALLLLLYTRVLPPALSLTIGMPLPVKIPIAILLSGLPGFLMGMPFPAGIRYLSEKNPDNITWAWAINGYFSVISTALATVIAAEGGYTWLLLLTAMGYAVAGIAPKPA